VDGYDLDLAMHAELGEEPILARFAVPFGAMRQSWLSLPKLEARLQPFSPSTKCKWMVK